MTSVWRREEQRKVLTLWLALRVLQRPALVPPQRRRRRYWVHPITSLQPERGHFVALYSDLRQHPEKFFNFCRMSVATFDKLLALLRADLTYEDTRMRESVSAEERLVVTLRFLATGNSYTSLHYEFLLGISTISVIVATTCAKLWDRLRGDMLPPPTAADWLKISEGFFNNAQFPNCLGALDGKHIRVRKPPHSGSLYYNYKSYFSVVLMALVDSNYNFVIVNIGAFGSSSDAAIFRTSTMGQLLANNQLAVPADSVLPGSAANPVPYVIVADEGFGLSPHVMRPFPARRLDVRKRIFNYRLTRARRYVECAFGILSGKWRVLHTAMQLSPTHAKSVVKACVVLHNFVRQNDFHCDQQDMEPMPLAPIPLDHNVHTRPGKDGLAIRDVFADYFMSPAGAVSWQMDCI